MTFFKSWLHRTTVWFTVLSVATLLFGLLFLPEQDHVTALSFLLFFPFSLAASAAGLLFRAKGLSAVWRYLLHYLIFLSALLIFVLLPSGALASPSFAAVSILLFTISWWISRGVVHILAAKLGK